MAGVNNLKILRLLFYSA